MLIVRIHVLWLLYQFVTNGHWWEVALTPAENNRSVTGPEWTGKHKQTQQYKSTTDEH